VAWPVRNVRQRAADDENNVARPFSYISYILYIPYIAIYIFRKPEKSAGFGAEPPFLSCASRQPGRLFSARGQRRGAAASRAVRLQIFTELN
jgi:hypothetical protein